MPKVGTAMWTTRYKVFKGMTAVVENLNNKCAFIAWANRYLNYEDWDAAAKYIACHNEDYESACKTFIELIKIYGKEGIK